jgi:hypothetical protein
LKHKQKTSETARRIAKTPENNLTIPQLNSGSANLLDREDRDFWKSVMSGKKKNNKSQIIPGEINAKGVNFRFDLFFGGTESDSIVFRASDSVLAITCCV